MSRRGTYNVYVVKKRRKSVISICLLAFVICGILTVQKQELEQKSLELTAQLSAVQDELDEEYERTQEIAAYKEYVQSDAFIEQEARNKLGLVYPDEIIFEAEE